MDDDYGEDDASSEFTAQTHSDFDPTREVGHDVDAATAEFVMEVKDARILRVQSENSLLTAMDYIDYLRINLEIEPELAWIAREMCAAPMPPNCALLVSKSCIVFFHDLTNDWYTVEHPLTQRYLKILEKARLDQLALRTKQSVNALVFNQPDVLFHSQFRNMQVPCQDCNVMQSTVKCNQCVMSFCDACFKSLHENCEGPRKSHTTTQTSCGSFCSACSKKKPQVYCGNCEDYFCQTCFEAMHKRGQRTNHRVMMVSVSDAEVVEPHKKCEECEDNQAAFHCDQCMDDFCIACFWRTHMNGERRRHTVTKVTLNPLCNQCNQTRASVFCEQCQELLCTDCFTTIHFKGNRQLHMCIDAMNILLLLERLDPGFQEHMRRSRPRVLWALTNLQGWCRGIESRKAFRRQKDLVTKIQQRWRGAMTRRKLLGMLDQYKWRKKEINNFFLPKTRQERMVSKQRFAAQYGKKDVAMLQTADTLGELRETIVTTLRGNEDPIKTQRTMDESQSRLQGAMVASAKPASGNDYVLPIYSTQGGGGGAGGGGGRKSIVGGTPGPPAKSGGGEIADRFKESQGERERTMELTKSDVRGARDHTIRELLRIDDRVQGERPGPQDTRPKEKGGAPAIAGGSATVRNTQYRTK